MHAQPRGIARFALEFHIQFYVWKETGRPLVDERKRRDGKPLRQYRILQWLGAEEDNAGNYVYEAQVSCLITGLDHDSWMAYLFLDTYYQGAKSCESVEHYHSEHSIHFRADPLTAGAVDSNRPVWEPREYFLTVYESRLTQVKHALENLVSRLLLKLAPYVSQLDDPLNGS